ncbi:estradiol 17-beta-dehydrogenase 11-like [Aphidius gifuensis]|uniref:estradiol 17-beta-dehydrogenase 11-like n=1 Tax=Aphidius gifuensis TaxID=684658 RepID=UPI001CDBEEFD|nr:estradiol 17-beta-dehydrogenase 11-like [Aphidius gifuensis]
MDLLNKMSIACDIFLFLLTALIDIFHSFFKSLIPRKYRCKKIDNEIVLITGGAGGLGRLLSIKLAALGAHVVIWDINESDIKKVVDEIKSLNGKCTGYVCDITDKQEIYKTASIIKKEIGNVTIIINNAGFAYGKAFVDTNDDEIEKIFKINIISHFLINKTFLPEMMKNNHGHIVTISSAAGLGGAYRLTGYSATKFAANGYHNALFADLKIDGYDGIQTTLVCPYFFHTVGLFPIVKPRFPDALDPNYLADEIVFGILTNKKTIVLPGYLKFVFPLNLPTKSYVKFLKKICYADELSESFAKYQKSMLKNDKKN